VIAVAAVMAVIVVAARRNSLVFSKCFMFIANKKALVVGLVIFFLSALIVVVFVWGAPKLAENFYKQGVKYFNSKDYTRAVDYFKIATVLNSKNGKYFAYLGYAYNRQKDQRTWASRPL